MPMTFQPRWILQLLCAGLCLAAADEPKRPLPAKHAKAGVSCHDCHQKENPAKAAVADDSCMICHGDYPAMADYTKQLNPNPHKWPGGKHPGPFACVDCHNQHKAPTVKCLECHPGFKLKPR
ncbi:MAG: cytochrome c3 family protein [Microthrixaceae bacterium]